MLSEGNGRAPFAGTSFSFSDPRYPQNGGSLNRRPQSQICGTHLGSFQCGTGTDTFCQDPEIVLVTFTHREDCGCEFCRAGRAGVVEAPTTTGLWVDLNFRRQDA
jgi:hypothetical protein